MEYSNKNLLDTWLMIEIHEDVPYLYHADIIDFN